MKDQKIKEVSTFNTVNVEEIEEPEKTYGEAMVLLKAKKEPKYDAEILKVLFPGERVQILGQTESGKYYEVKVRGFETHGFVNSRYIGICNK